MKMLWLIFLSGCFVAGSLEREDPNTRHEPMASDAGMLDSSMHDAESSLLDAADDEPPPLQSVSHAACRGHDLSRLPDEPIVTTGLSGVSYNLWIDATCESLPELVTCDADNPCPKYGLCVFPVAGEPGFCTLTAQNSECDVGSAPLGFRDGTCFACVPQAVKRAACCAGFPGLDCRLWRFGGSSGPGDLCAEHADCESGLICQGSPYYEYGRCTCPGVDIATLRNPPGCSTFSGPAWWGKPPVPMLPVGTCRAAKASGFSVESLMVHALPLALATASGEPNEPEFLVVDAFGTVTHGVLQAGSVALKIVDGVVGNAAMDFARDTQGRAHVVFGGERPTYLRRGLDGAWHLRDLTAWLPVGSPKTVALALRDDGTPVIGLVLGNVGSDTAHVLFPEGDPFGGPSWQSVSLGMEEVNIKSLSVRIDALDKVHVLVTQQNTIWYAHGDTAKFTSSVLALGEHAQFVRGSANQHLQWLRGAMFPVPTAGLGSLEDIPGGIQPLWTAADERFAYLTPLPHGAYDHDGRLTVVHPAPSGLVLHESNGEGMTTTQLATEAVFAQVAYDSMGGLHVFAVVGVVDYDQSTGFLYELRHWYRGECPSPGAAP